jgi:hypothetical protein
MGPGGPAYVAFIDPFSMKISTLTGSTPHKMERPHNASGSRRRLTQSLAPLHVTPPATLEKLGSRQSPLLRRFWRPPSTDASFLRRRYPQVLVQHNCFDS